MPFALLIVALFLIIAAVRNTQDNLFTLIKGDFSGDDNFVFWFVAILLIGSVGYIQKLKPLSTAFLVLLLVVLFLKKGTSSGVGGGFFTQFIQALSGTDNASVNATMLANSNNILDNIRQQLHQTFGESATQ